MCIRWVVFDVVGTLLTPEPAVAEAYQRIGARLGSRVDVEEVSRRFRKAFFQSDTVCFPQQRQRRTSEPEERARWQWIVAQVFDDVADGDACFQQLWNHFADPSAWRVYPEVASVVERLRALDLRLAMASNFDARLHRLCADEPALRAIEPRLVSSEVGFRKPAPEFYRAVIAACQVPANQILMVGDDWDADVVAARRAGLRACWLNRRGATDIIAPAVTTLDDLFGPRGLREELSR